jgi:hypothetical protein
MAQKGRFVMICNDQGVIGGILPTGGQLWRECAAMPLFGHSLAVPPLGRQLGKNVNRQAYDPVGIVFSGMAGR